jgi:hypothetical protein
MMGCYPATVCPAPVPHRPRLDAAFILVLFILLVIIFGTIIRW